MSELLAALRASQVAPDGPRDVPVIAPSLPSEIRQLLDLPDTPAPRPRTRNMRRFDAQGRRLPAGPAPPFSWLNSSRFAPTDARRTRLDPSTSRRNGKLDRLPGVTQFPLKSSLVATCLRHIALHWDYHQHYNQYYLATLPTKIRTILLSYIAVYGPQYGIGHDGLKAVIRPDDAMLDQWSGNDDFERLDLAGALGRSVSFKQLKDIIIPPQSEKEEEESWDVPDYKLAPSINAPLKSLKILSLADPSPTVSWAKLLAFASLIPTVTHLSLANWPTPTLTPNSVTTTMTSRYSKNMQYGGTGFYSHNLDQDWSEAGSILRRLSNAFYSLEWLDIDGCEDWFPALRWDSPDSPGIDWVKQWGKIRRLRMHSSITKPVLDATAKDIMSYRDAIINAKLLEKVIRQKRGWITVEYDEWNKYDGRGAYRSIENLSLEGEFEEVLTDGGNERSFSNRQSGGSGSASSYWD